MIKIFCVLGYFATMVFWMFDNLNSPQIDMMPVILIAVFYYGFYGSTQLDLNNG